MKVAIIAVHTDYHRRGAHHRTLLQPQIGPLIAGLLPDEADIEVVNDTWTDPDWRKAYDLVFVSAMVSDYERARQIGQYYRARGAQTVLGGRMADAYPRVCLDDFDAVVIGDPEDTVPRIYADARAGRLQRLYRSAGYQPHLVPVPRCDLAARQQPAPFGLEVTRGCPFRCDFCALTGGGTRFESRPVEGVIRDIRAIQASLRAVEAAEDSEHLLRRRVLARCRCASQWMHGNSQADIKDPTRSCLFDASSLIRQTDAVVRQPPRVTPAGVQAVPKARRGEPFARCRPIVLPLQAKQQVAFVPAHDIRNAGRHRNVGEDQLTALAVRSNGSPVPVVALAEGEQHAPRAHTHNRLVRAFGRPGQLWPSPDAKRLQHR